MTIGEKYNPAMQVSNQQEADEMFERLVQDTISYGRSRQEAEEIELCNLGYYAGYCSEETRRKVQGLYHAIHPIFGRI